MRKFQVIYAILFAAIVGVFSSCTSDETATAPVVTATIQGTPTYKPGTTVEIKLAISSSSDLKTFAVASDVIALSADSKVTTTVPADALKTATEFKSDLGTTGSVEVNYSFKIPTNAAKGTKTTVTFTVTDKDGLTTSTPVDITVANATEGTLKTNSITLGAQSATAGSFAASFEGTVYTVATAKANATSIDLLYYYGDTNKEAIFSPAGAAAAGISSFGELSTWSVKNSNMFVKAAAADFDNATYASVATLAASASLGVANGGASPIAGLKTGDVYGFKTYSGKFGVFKVTSVSSGASGSISISVKIQDAAPAK